MSNISMSDAELLKYAIENGMLDTALVQERIEMQKREEILEKHTYAIWQGKDEKWRTYLPDEEKGRKLVKRNTQKAIEDCVIAYWRGNSEEEIQKREAKEITLKKIFPRWIDYKQIHTESTSYTKRITAEWQRFYTKEIELINMPFQKMTKLYLDTWAHGMIKKYKMTKKMYYNMSIILRQCLDYAVECGYIESNVFAEVKINSKLFRRVKKKTGKTQVYTQNEEERLIQDMIRRFNNNMNNTAPLMVLLEFETGLRIGEVCAVKFSDVQGNYIYVQRQEVREFEKVDDFKMKFKEFKIVEYTKTEDGFRNVYLTDTAKMVIEIARIINQRNGCYDPNGFIFCKNGKNINHHSVQAMIKRGCEYVNMEVKTSHKIRKTYISTLIDSGLNIDEIRRMVGHSDERTTYGNYCFNRLTSRQTENAIENALSKQKVIKGNQFSNIISLEKTSILAAN